MKKNLLLIILLLPIFFGCSAEYNITIENQKVIEDFVVMDQYSSSVDEAIRNNINGASFARRSRIIDEATTKVEGGEYYDVKEYKNGDLQGLRFKYDFNLDTIYDSNAINSCYKLFNSITQDDLYIFSTGKENGCFLNENLDTLTIHLKTNHKVKDSNADRIDGYNYFWDINRNNYKNKSIYFEIYKDKYIFNYENRIMKILIGSGIGLVFALLVVVLMRKKINNKNRI